MPTIRNHWLPFLTFFILVKVKRFMMRCLMHIRQIKLQGASREDFLLLAAQIPGIYVPAFYDVTYHEDGTIASFEPNRAGAPRVIQKQLIIDMDKGYNAPLKNRLFHLLRQHRTE